MKQVEVQFFTEKEEEFVNLLTGIGTNKNLDKVLVYLVNTSEVTARAIEHGTDMRQPEVSLVMKFLMEQGWITCQERPSTNKG